MYHNIIHIYSKLKDFLRHNRQDVELPAWSKQSWNSNIWQSQLTEVERRFVRSITHTVQYHSRALLDTVLFTNAAHTAKVQYDNSYISHRYNDPVTGLEANAYGHITRMFKHSIGTTTCNDNFLCTRVIVQCIWYEVQGTNPRSKLPQVILHNRWTQRNKFQFLKDAWPHNLAIKPSLGPLSIAGQRELFDVIDLREVR